MKPDKPKIISFSDEVSGLIPHVSIETKMCSFRNVTAKDSVQHRITYSLYLIENTKINCQQSWLLSGMIKTPSSEENFRAH